MENQETIDYLNNLEQGMFCTINLPPYGNEEMPVTAMYMGKDEDGRYNFFDTGRFVLSKDFIKNKSITIDKKFDEEKAVEIYSKIHMQFNKNNERTR